VLIEIEGWKRHSVDDIIFLYLGLLVFFFFFEQISDILAFLGLFLSEFIKLLLNIDQF